MNEETVLYIRTSYLLTVCVVQGLDTSQDVTAALVETLSTSRGTEFYVIKELGKDTKERGGNGGEKKEEKEGSDTEEDVSMMLTETEEEVKEMPDYLRSIHISAGEILTVKQA